MLRISRNQEYFNCHLINKTLKRLKFVVGARQRIRINNNMKCFRQGIKYRDT